LSAVEVERRAWRPDSDPRSNTYLLHTQYPPLWQPSDTRTTHTHTHYERTARLQTPTNLLPAHSFLHTLLPYITRRKLARFPPLWTSTLVLLDSDDLRQTLSRILTTEPYFFHNSVPSIGFPTFFWPRVDPNCKFI